MRRTLMIAIGSVAATVIAVPALAPPADGMRDAIRRLISELRVIDRVALENPFDDELRLRWNYTPVDRTGLALGGLQPGERERVWELLATGLSELGLQQAREIIALEGVLYETSGGNPQRDPGLYWLNLFGSPATRGRWGWRFEGHHLSLNFTVLEDHVVGTTPAFFGGSPARVDTGTRRELRPFAVEEDAARRLLATLDESQRSAAIVASIPHQDILTGNQHYTGPLADTGVRYSDLSPEQRAALVGLVEHYASRLEPSLAQSEMAEIRAAGLDSLRFAWAGSDAPGMPHYYRIQGPTFVIEYDNTQDDANHVHTVWRNFDRDFGRDPLREHLAAEHGGSHEP